MENESENTTKFNLIHKYHNPKIEEDFPEVWIERDGVKKEVLIERLHFIWIGSALTRENAKHIPDWVQDDCGYSIYIWYDSKFMTSVDDIFKTVDFIQELNDQSIHRRVYLCDIRNYAIMTANFSPIVRNMVKIYECEVGIKKRPGMPEYTREIRNWGMGTDILRLIILYLYGGFYMDIDIIPVKLCELEFRKRIANDEKYEIKSCENAICMNSPFAGSYNNNALYYHPNGRVKGWQEQPKTMDRSYENDTNRDIIVKILMNGWKQYKQIMSNYCYYLLYNYRTATIRTMGPGALKGYFLYTLIGFEEDRKTQGYETSSWLYTTNTDSVRAKLLIDLFDDEELVESTYKLIQRDWKVQKIQEGSLNPYRKETTYDRSDFLVREFIYKLSDVDSRLNMCDEDVREDPIYIRNIACIIDAYLRPYYSREMFRNIEFWNRLILLIKGTVSLTNDFKAKQKLSVLERTSIEQYKYQLRLGRALEVHMKAIEQKILELSAKMEMEVIEPFEMELSQIVIDFS